MARKPIHLAVAAVLGLSVVLAVIAVNSQANSPGSSAAGHWQRVPLTLDSKATETAVISTGVEAPKAEQPAPRPQVTEPQLPVPVPQSCIGQPPAILVDGKPCQLGQSIEDLQQCYAALPPGALHVIDVTQDAKCGGFYGGASNPHNPIFLRPNSSDPTVFQHVWIENEFGFLDELFVRAGMPHGPATILDLGMNCGVAALYMSLRFPQAQIVSVEPSATTFAVASLNLVHQIRHFRELGAAEGQGGGYAAILDRHQGAWAFGVTRVTGDERKVATFGVFDVGYIMRKYGWDRIDYLKVDIEGSEDSVCDAILDSSAQWIKTVRCVTMELHDRYIAGVTKKCESAMSQAGLKFIKYHGELMVWCRDAATA